MRRGALALVAGGWLIAGCSSLYNYEPETYLVRAGDTLYSIAFRHGIDPQALAAWNGLDNPDRIFVGQRIALYPGTSAQSGRPASGAPASGASTSASGAAPSGVSASGASASRASAAGAAAAGSGSARSAPPRWRWPVTGRIVSRFGDRRVLSTGIGIAGMLGDDIGAAAAGRVVYVGSGLPDYGQLIIIEHDATLLSAYGYNRRIVVGQGQVVAAGQKIAEMGPGPDGAARLHFEIRRNGEPIDPLSLLPD